MSIKDLKQTIENAVLEFSRENEIKSMDIHITTTEKVKCDMMGYYQMAVVPGGIGESKRNRNNTFVNADI